MDHVILQMMHYLKKTSTMNNNEKHDFTTHAVDTRWNVTNDTLAIVLHNQISLSTNNNEHCVLLYIRHDYH